MTLLNVEISWNNVNFFNSSQLFRIKYLKSNETLVFLQNTKDLRIVGAITLWLAWTPLRESSATNEQKYHDRLYMWPVDIRVSSRSCALIAAPSETPHCHPILLSCPDDKALHSPTLPLPSASSLLHAPPTLANFDLLYLPKLSPAPGPSHQLFVTSAHYILTQLTSIHVCTPQNAFSDPLIKI